MKGPQTSPGVLSIPWEGPSLARGCPTERQKNARVRLPKNTHDGHLSVSARDCFQEPQRMFSLSVNVNLAGVNLLDTEGLLYCSDDNGGRS